MLGSCQVSCRGHAGPKANLALASASAAARAGEGSRLVELARARHFDVELSRARAEWQSKPSLECDALSESGDRELCRAANRGLVLLAEQVAAASERVLPTLETAALDTTRLSQRLRYLSLSELSQKRVLGGDAGAVASPLATAAASTSVQQIIKGGGRRTLELSDGPISRLMSKTVRLERTLLRHLGAYLEYAPEQSQQRAAFEAVKRLSAARPQWLLLDHLIREAALLETDPELKRELRALADSSGPRSRRPLQSPDSK